MAVLKDDTKYAIIDPFERTRAFHTETKGDLPVGSTGYIIANQKETADEIKEKMPYAVVSEMGGLRPPTRTLFVMPALPWKREKEGE